MKVHLVNPSHQSFGTAVITPRWMFVIAALGKKEPSPPFAGSVRGFGTASDNQRVKNVFQETPLTPIDTAGSFAFQDCAKTARF
jgi:hypothetical protein